jgi:catechol 2,3-dioxygenase-like lactoylglutathione lyase family enzyme
MAVLKPLLKPHLALTVSDLGRSVPFYVALLGTEPAKVRPGYAKFELEDPPLNLTLNEGDRGGSPGALNHAGIQVSTTDEVLIARLRLRQAGLATFDEMDTTCCYARQDKIWVRDPDGTPWEVFAVTEADVEPEEAEPARVDAQPCC